METTERYKLNKELAQMLKGGVIMDVQHLNRLRSQRLPAHVQLWLLREYQLTSEQQAEYHV